ncbi:CPCC family cysteine-rich protein [Amycolatopsis sp. NPDC048633]|uniref:CPCC family cysteine-rich protein n=1 Tax=Amycolatopsis sp. NPDC048633 TaxID=3157095 RepID=UPI0033FF0795
MDTPADYPCPCCGHHTFEKPPGSHDICRVCFWEDDDIQLRWPDRAGGANSLTLVDSQRAYAEMGAMEYRFTGLVRMATPDEPLDDGWRPIDLDLDDFESMDHPHRAPWPADPTVLYWWRPTFWRRR